MSIISTEIAAAMPKWLFAMPSRYCSTGSVVLSPLGPPSRNTQIWAKTLKSHNVDRNVTIISSDLISGHVTARNVCQPVAPSMPAAS